MHSLQQLQSTVRGCRLCLEAGHTIAPGPVFSGCAGARVFLIGQAPGPTEAVVKRPFNGNSGRRLFQWLAEAGWQEDAFRARHYMTAVTKCYPGKHPNGKGDRVPTREEQALCRPYLTAELSLVNPRVILLVGKLALQLLFPANLKLTDMIGRALYFPPEQADHPLHLTFDQGNFVTAFNGAADGRFIVPLPHPSGASLWPNRPQNKILIRQALQLLHDIRVAWKL